MMYSLGIYPLITKPTRITYISATLIDNIFTDEMTCRFVSGVLINDLKGLTGLPSTSLAWGRGWHQDKEAYGLSSALVNSNNLLCLLTPLSTTYSRIVFK